jgi:mannonate dehydratase
MLERWRWFGPLDKISLSEVAQTGAQGIVTALHEVPYGEVWTREAISARCALIAEAPGQMHWAVVESLPVHEDIKRGAGDLSGLFANYRQSLANLAAEGVTTVCYNFMPLLDWTRTQLDAPVAGGGTALRFDMVQMAAFDLHMLDREGAEADFTPAVVAAAGEWAETASEDDRATLLHAIMAGLPGAYARYDVAGLREALAPWAGFTADDLRASLKRFLAEVVPAADELGVRLCVHPDDPPWPILGLPRIVSTEADLAFLLGCEDSLANGLTLCAGALGAHPENDIPKIAERFADRVHFAHIRNVARDPDGSFKEAAHLGGDTDIPAVMKVYLQEEARRRAEGRADAEIPFRPDHGHELLSDIGRGTHPGYPLIGRMRGLAELRGVIAGLTA